MIDTAPHPDDRPAEQTPTVICAYDTPEAERIRREVGLNRGNSIYAVSPDSIRGVLQVKLYVIETPRFADRPDADRIQKQLRMSSLIQTPHPGWSATWEA
ncbi:hypothetical protein FHR32_007789 [Streptosporangium album]|uniref:Uncharacterized protein n=1 Tax=Streptosporangium album TaxID=47479 RepID=A0A7W7S3S5_9ACTN|nr:hypothetical protein [Streptosporangium album]MBB4943389.1 hypothetical protein [Streptosporangium album]